MTQITQSKGIGISTIKKLEQFGITTTENLSKTSPTNLLKTSGIGSGKIITLYQSIGYKFSKPELDQINRSTINSKVKISKSQPNTTPTQKSSSIPTDLITIESKNTFRPYIVNNFEVSNIIIYNSSGFIYETNSGWFENYSNKFSKDIKSIEISEPIRRNKVNLTNSENFYVKSHTGFYVSQWDKRKVTLYIHESEAQLKKLESQTLLYKTDKQEVRADIFELNINGQKFTITKNTTYNTTNFGSTVDSKMQELKDLNIRITEYELTQIMKHYNLVKRND